MLSAGSLYATPEDVRRYLRLYLDAAEVQSLDDEYLTWLIEMVMDEIDKMSGSAWRVRESDLETHTLGYPWFYGYWIVGSPVFLKHFPLRTKQLDDGRIVPDVIELRLWNGDEYEDWLDFDEYGRGRRWWADPELGIIFISRIWYRFGGMEVKVKYRYGYDKVDARVKELTILMVARRILESERYSMVVAEGGSMSVINQLQLLDRRIAELKSWLVGIKPVAGGMIS
ncbi:MAG: hypothetical protein DRQ10_08725 [Candidatus Hydrothermota bacterium]|nr:MAG: hypothetical protein DRQ10_08725 [Candidatus Hydrothermae bacterium]